MTVYQGVGVPGPDQGGSPWNFYVPVINLADAYIDYYQVQAFNNWYDGFAGGSLGYYQDVYLNWRNKQGYSPVGRPIPGFDGVRGEKLIMGLLASDKAGIPDYYGSPETIRQFKSWLRDTGYGLAGFMLWDSNWDKQNSFAISNACKE